MVWKRGTSGSRPVTGKSRPASTGGVTPQPIQKGNWCCSFMAAAGVSATSTATMDLCGACARRPGAHYLSVDFRRAPEHKFPAAHEDCYQAALWAFENCEALGIDPARIGAMGDSAGAALATAVAWQIARQTNYRLNSLYLLYPFLDLRDDHQAYASRISFGDGNYLVGRAGLSAAKQWYLKEDTSTEDPLVSPIFIPDLESLPRTTIITTGHDPNLDEGKLFAEKLKQSGVRVSATHFASAFHGFMPFGVLDVAGDSVQSLAKAIAEQ